MRNLIAIAFFASIGLSGVSVSQAMPIATPGVAQAGAIIQIAGGCGVGRHRGPYGGCRPLYSCPPGWHPGPFGRHCFRN